MNCLNAIIYGLIDSDVKIVSGVPGFPITELMNSIGKKIKNQWSINEKVALELALGSSVCNERSAVITKHVGMNLLADPLVSAPTHTIGAGVVIISGDDPGVTKSQNEMDSRAYGLVAEVLVFDPSNPQNAYDIVREAYELSEKTCSPVIIRVTDRLLKMEGELERKIKSGAKTQFDKNLWLFTMLGKHQRFHKYYYPIICKYSEDSKLNSCNKTGKIGIISSGYPSTLVDFMSFEEISHLSLCVVSPLPYELINNFINSHERILVIEETEPIIERQLSKRVFGKLTGHIPYGIVEIKDIKNAIENINKDILIQNITPETIEKRGARPICEDCPYLPLYKAIKKLDVPVAGDVGCSILSASPPISLILAAYSLGSSISTASGFNRKGVALIGDFGFAHSGICGLINAVHNNHELIVIVLQNKVAAMTGGQSVPDLTKLICSYVKDTVIINASDDIESLLFEKIKLKGISVILVRGECLRY